MEILEFLRQRKRMCDYYGDDTCVCNDSRGACPAFDMNCSFATKKPEQLVAVVEQWAKEHPEGTEQEREQERPKRTNKDVLVAAFPSASMDDDGIPVACPRALDTQYGCNEFKTCSVCRRAHWLTEAEK